MRKEKKMWFSYLTFSQNLSSSKNATWGRGDCIISAPPRTFVKQLAEKEKEMKK